MQPIQYQSCFISDRSQDDEFARRLHEKMRGEKLRVWFAPEDMQGGQKLIEQIDRAIQVNDRLLLVLSEHSLKTWLRRFANTTSPTSRTGKTEHPPPRLESALNATRWTGRECRYQRAVWLNQ